ncbi:hypothetical protein NQZ79_g3974 [Umbelopsis isabellina]|nr:hypothetical protein NQZ79_g3974 [Umbelopsis isabellina]
MEQSSVRAQLEQLRLEHARSRRNAYRSQPHSTQTPEIHPFLNYESGAPIPDIRTRSRPGSYRPIPGPAPPRSWITTNRAKVIAAHDQLIISERIRKRQQARRELRSLCETCAYNLGYQTLFNEDYAWHMRKVVKNLPIHLKEEVLYAISEIGGMNDRLLPYFALTEVSELCLANCTLSAELFFKEFWKVETRRHIPVKEVKDTWEDIDDDDSDNMEILSPPLEQFEERQYVNLYLVARSIKPSIDLSNRWVISTKLTHLTILDISFFRPHLPALATSELLVTTLPHLISLSTAGTFQRDNGSAALSVLSKGLRKLQFWDIGYHEWITPEVICGNASVVLINWDRDLQNLDFLSLENIGPGNSSENEAAKEVRRQFYEDVQVFKRAKRRPIVLMHPQQYRTYNQYSDF